MVTYMNNLKREFGKRLAEVRKSKKLKQEDLREMINAPTVQMISGWENGHSFPSTTYLIILAKKLDISLDYLLLGKPNDKSSKQLFTYKDALEYILDFINMGLFELSGYNFDHNTYATILESLDQKIADFKHEYDNLLVASKTLRPELYKQAIMDLLDKYDIPIKQKNK